MLAVLSGIFGLGLELIRLPAALLLGPMIAGIVLAIAGSNLRVPQQLVLIAQAVIGYMIARSIPPTIIGEMLRNWPLFLTVVIAVIAASSTAGLVAHPLRKSCPGTTAVWGSSPGAAPAMMLMAGAYGADIRLVAFMQYLRVLLVALAATIVARLWTTAGSITATTITWFPQIHWLSFAETLLLIAFGTFAARLRRIPAAPLLLPIGFGVACRTPACSRSNCRPGCSSPATRLSVGAPAWVSTERYCGTLLSRCRVSCSRSWC